MFAKATQGWFIHTLKPLLEGNPLRVPWPGTTGAITTARKDEDPLFTPAAILFFGQGRIQAYTNRAEDTEGWIDFVLDEDTETVHIIAAGGKNDCDHDLSSFLEAKGLELPGEFYNTTTDKRPLKLSLSWARTERAIAEWWGYWVMESINHKLDMASS